MIHDRVESDINKPQEYGIVAREEELRNITTEDIIKENAEFTEDKLGCAAVYRILEKTGALDVLNSPPLQVDSKGGRVFGGITNRERLAYKSEHAIRPNVEQNLKTVVLFVLKDPADRKQEEALVVSDFLDEAYDDFTSREDRNPTETQETFLLFLAANNFLDLELERLN